MLRKTFTLLVLIPVVLLFIAIGWSCIERTIYEDVYVKDITFSCNGHVRDTARVTTEALFDVVVEGKKECCMRSMPLVSSAYATNLQRTWKTTLLQPSFHLSFDRDIMVDSVTVPAHANLLDNPRIRQIAFWSNNDIHAPILYYALTLRDSTLVHMQLDTLPYRVSFSCTSTSGTPFSREIPVIFKR